MRRLLLALLALIAPAAPLSAQSPGSMVIRVVDDSTGAVAGRADILLDIGRLLHTDERGELRMTGLAPGEWTLKAMRVGYRPQFVVVRVPSGGELQVEIALRRETLALPAIVGIGKRLDRRLARARFYERRKHGPTVSWDWREIRRMPPGDLPYLLERIPIFRVVRTDTSWALVSGRGQLGLPGECVVTLVLDGQRVDPARLAGLPLDLVAGVEAYPGPARTPAELGAGGARCGVVALWTGMTGQ